MNLCMFFFQKDAYACIYTCVYDDELYCTACCPVVFSIKFLTIILFLGVFLESPTEFTVDAKSVAGSGSGRVECLLTSPSGRIVRCPVKNMTDGTYQVQYAPYEPGNY